MSPEHDDTAKKLITLLTALLDAVTSLAQQFELLRESVSVDPRGSIVTKRDCVGEPAGSWGGRTRIIDQFITETVTLTDDESDIIGVGHLYQTYYDWYNAGPHDSSRLATYEQFRSYFELLPAEVLGEPITLNHGHTPARSGVVVRAGGAKWYRTPDRDDYAAARHDGAARQ